jgi:ABC-type bacteriocin/lantibiotic exporter with double-glycine peptidase domain
MLDTTNSTFVIEKQDLTNHIESLSLRIEEIGFESNRPLSRSVIRESLEQSYSGLASLDEIVWHAWVHDALHSLGLRDQVVDCTIDQFLEMAEDGVQVVIFSGCNSWLAIVKSKRNDILVSGLDSKKTSKWLSLNELRAVLHEYISNGHIRCVIVNPESSIAATPTLRNLSPLKRLWELLKPEWSDIWIIIVFSLVIGLLTLATPIAVETLVNTVAFGKFLQPVIVLSLMLLAFLAFSAALKALQTFIAEIIQRRLFARVAADISHRLPHVQVEAMVGKSTRELVNRFFEIVVVQKVASQLLLDGVSLLLGTVIGMTMLAFYHPWLLGFDVMLLLMLSVMVFVLGRGAVKTSIKESKVKYKMAAWLEDIAGCPTTFRYEGAARFALEHTDHLTSEYLLARARHFRILMRQIIFALGMQAVSSAVLLGLGGWLVISGQLTLGQLVAAELIVAVIVGAFAKLGKHMESFYDLLASVDKLGVLFDLPLERQDGFVGLPLGNNENVEIQNLNYHLPNGHQLLNNCNLTIRPGDQLAITGKTGSGKSKLLEILFGLRTPSKGQVKFMGAEIREFRPEALRRYVALVRDIEVFQGTITENVAVGRLDVSTTDVRNTLERIGLLDDILCLPEQLDTQLTSTGYPLSTIQLQHLMLARACSGNPSLLLLDGTLDPMPDKIAENLLKWLSDPRHPWKLVLVTRRDRLVNLCNRHIELSK